MSNTNKEKHIHKLMGSRYKTGQKFFFCTGEDCTFKINKDTAIGKRTICWRCGNPFTLTVYSLTLVKPHCTNCHIAKGSRTARKETNDPNKIISISDILSDKAEFDRRENPIGRRVEDQAAIPIVAERTIDSLRERLLPNTETKDESTDLLD